ncbi:MAG: hypothetical protein MI743_15445 [Sneathiellales bacterium]|nr:hypothetical protein [Sneathiellales bacterium]
MSLLFRTYSRFFFLAVSGLILAVTSTTTGRTSERDGLPSELQGYWKGYSEKNCFNPAAKDTELNIYARVRENRFDFELRPYSQDKGKLKAFKGTGHINGQEKLTFERPFDVDDKITVSFQQSPRLISVKSKTIKECMVHLRKTAFATLPDYFKGELAIEDKRPQPKKEIANTTASVKKKSSPTSSPPVPRQKSKGASSTKVTNMEGTWTGKGGYGCLYIDGRPIEPEIVTDIQEKKVGISLSYRSSQTGEQTLYQGQHNLSANDWVAIQQIHPDIGQTQISINRRQKLVFVKLGKSCEIQLSKGQFTPGSGVTASVRKVTSPPVIQHRQKAPTPPQTPGLSTKEQKRFQGYWAGFAGTGCIEVGTWPASVDVGAYVEKNKLKLLVEYATVWRKGTIPLKAEVVVPKSRKLVFNKPFGEVNNLIVLFKPQEDRIEIQMDSDCKINLKRASRRTVPANFVPDRTKADRT